MDEMRKLIFQMLRRGESISQIIFWQEVLKDELLIMEDYNKAMKEADFAP
jgi:Na+-transporting NADH:ubiquinone oxidoreductase subunit NqrF